MSAQIICFKDIDPSSRRKIEPMPYSPYLGQRVRSFEEAQRARDERVAQALAIIKLSSK